MGFYLFAILNKITKGYNISLLWMEPIFAEYEKTLRNPKLHNMNPTLSNRLSLFICVMIGVFLMAFTGYKAYHISLTFDESATWIDQMYHSFWDIVTYKFPNASNHVFNTLYMKYCSAYIGNSEFELRSLSWFSHLVYIFFSIKIVQNLKRVWFIISAFILLNVNPYLLDYFSLARGYGLAMAMMMGSLYYLVQYINNGRKWYQILTLLFGILAVLANFSWLNFYLGLSGAVFVFHFFKTKEKNASFVTFARSAIPLFVAGILLFCIIYLPLKRLQDTHQFFFGGKTGFWKDTILQLVKDSLYTKPAESFAPVLFACILIIFLSSVIFVFMKLFSGKSGNILNPVYYILLILFITGLSTEIQHLFLGTLFLTDRTALMFFPLSSLFIILAVSEITESTRMSRFVKPILFIVSFLKVIHFLYVLNFNGVHDFYYDSSTKKMIKDLDKSVPQNLRKPNAIILKEPWIFVPTTNFYLRTRNMNWVRPLEMFKKDDGTEPDYFYEVNVDANDRAQYRREHKTIIADYPETNTTLVKWKNNETMRQ